MFSSQLLLHIMMENGVRTKKQKQKNSVFAIFLFGAATTIQKRFFVSPLPFFLGSEQNQEIQIDWKYFNIL
jgi:hypothetical protein